MLALDPRQWFKKKETKPPGCVGLKLSEFGVALSYGTAVDGEFEVQFVEYTQVAPDDQLEFVKNWVSQHKLKNADCHFILNQQDYELELIEAPQVAEDEMRDAVRWRLKELIQIPLEEAAVDVFPLPEDAYRGRMKMMYAVATPKAIIQQHIKFMRQAGLAPAVIDIPEMCLRNISLYLPEMEHGTVALLKMHENNGDMVMYSHDALYLTRHIEMGYSSFVHEPGALSLDNGVMVERLILDLQRSLDYYESQLGKGVASKIFVLPIEEESVHLTDDLQSHIDTPILNFDCREHIPFATGANPSISEQAHCLSVIGAVLRRAA